VFCPDVAGCRALGLEGLAAPLIDAVAEGLWLGEPDAQTAVEHGLSVLDHAQVLGVHLEALLRPRLASFVGVSDIDRELDMWVGQEGPAGAEAIARALPRRRARVGFVRLLERLVAEQVPIIDLDVLLNLYAEAGEEPLDLVRLVEEARLAVAPRVAARGFDREVLALDPSLIDRVRDCVKGSGPRALFSIEEHEATELLGQVTTLLAGKAPAATALLCADESLRPFVQRLVDGCAPGVPVLSERELNLLASATTGLAGSPT
jgi:flagellar biosynthesis component FlhA